MRKGRSRRATTNAARNKSICCTRIDERRSVRVTVKKNVPPGTMLRRYLTMSEYNPGYRSAHPGYDPRAARSGSFELHRLAWHGRRSYPVPACHYDRACEIRGKTLYRNGLAIALVTFLALLAGTLSASAQKGTKGKGCPASATQASRDLWPEGAVRRRHPVSGTIPADDRFPVPAEARAPAETASGFD